MAIENNNAGNPNKSDQKFTRKGYSINEFCSMVPCSRAFYYKLVNAGKIKPVQVLGLVVITADEVERFTREELAA